MGQGIFCQRRLSSCEKFSQLLDENPYYPFQRDEDGTFVYSVRYVRYYVGIFGIMLSLTLILVFLALEWWLSSFFLWFVCLLLLSGFVVFQYRDTRYYYLDDDMKIYSFSVGNKIIVEGNYHNVYIRLRSVYASGGRVYYYLIFNGYRMDVQTLTGTSEQMHQMRLLGQRLARNLNINYFDNANVSPFHEVRHLKPEAGLGKKLV